MLLELLERSGAVAPGAADSIPSRAVLAAVGNLLLVLLAGPLMIRWLRRRCREPNKSASPRLAELHRDKHATPTMGGLFVVGGLLLNSLAFGDLGNPYLLILLGTTLLLTALGGADDWIKLTTAARGMSARGKLAGQTLIALAAAGAVAWLHVTDGVGGNMTDGVGGSAASFDGWWLARFLAVAVVVVVGSSNAVNLTDGLDGLAAGSLLFVTAAVAAVAFASGYAPWGDALHIASVPGASETAVVACGLIGGLLGFLWFNCHPASVFMGDTGSLPLGGLLGLIAVMVRQEWILLLAGGLFAVEAASVIVQVGFYRWKRRRVLLCAPLHHHFQFLGWPESKIVVRFWIASAVCATLTLTGMKLRPGEQPSVMAQDSGRGQRTARSNDAIGTGSEPRSPAPTAQAFLPPHRKVR